MCISQLGSFKEQFPKNHMPAGAAAKVFEGFITEWGLAKSYNEKMILVDALLHEFHLSLISGAAHRPVAMNFIDGTRSRIEGIVNELSKKN